MCVRIFFCGFQGGSQKRPGACTYFGPRLNNFEDLVLNWWKWPIRLVRKRYVCNTVAEIPPEPVPEQAPAGTSLVVLRAQSLSEASAKRRTPNQHQEYPQKPRMEIPARVHKQVNNLGTNIPEHALTFGVSLEALGQNLVGKGLDSLKEKHAPKLARRRASRSDV
eukprot:186922-Rhodomonas_salina.1